MLSWFSELTERERRTMAACFGGWALDAFDVQIFSFVIPTLLALWRISSGQAGELATITLLVSAFGGWLGGALADRYGRMRVLQITILWYAVFTFLCGFAQNYGQLFVFRALQGIGFGGEWAAGAVLMGEVIRDRFRGRAVGLVQTGWAFGWGAAALAYTVLFAFVRPELAFRVLFWLGLLPALLVIWIRRNVSESDLAPREAAAASGVGHVFSAMRPPYLATTWRLVLMVIGAQGGVYALATWLPTYLKTVRHLTSVGAG
ncbi:MAG: MFS transporter, partial [Acetobacteraceae bacterium]|nr:MFS transporter [Acetobacteraceae bacterium]